MSTQLVAYEGPGELTVSDVVRQVGKIQDLMKQAMHEGEHFGVIPGTGSKPTLLKPGAEKLAFIFRLDPQYDVVTNIEQPDVISFTIRCTLYHMVSGSRVGSGLGSCSSRESKYAYRKGERVCPECGEATIIKGKKEYGGGWLCYQKKGGCGAKFVDGDTAITDQDTGRIPNPDIWDQHNTILKMASKRALVAAVLNATAASDIFTQDVEDLPVQPPAPKEEEAPRPRQTRSAPHVPEEYTKAQTAFKNGMETLGLTTEDVLRYHQLDSVEAFNEMLVADAKERGETAAQVLQRFTNELPALANAIRLTRDLEDSAQEALALE